MKCPKCNQNIDDNSIFCEYCGARIETNSTIEQNDIKSSPSKQTPWWKQKWVIPVIIALAIVIILVSTVPTMCDGYSEAYDDYYGQYDSVQEETYYYEQPAEEVAAEEVIVVDAAAAAAE